MTATTVGTSELSVSDVMSTRLVTVGPDDSLLAAWELMARGGIHHLPVVVNGRCLAVLDDRLVATTLASSLVFSGRRVGDVLPPRVHCVHGDASLRRAAEIMHVEGVTAVPVVVERMRFVGLVTDRDVVAAVARGAA